MGEIDLSHFVDHQVMGAPQHEVASLSSPRKRRSLPEAKPSFLLHEIGRALTQKYPKLRFSLSGTSLVVRGDNPQRFLTIQPMRRQKSTYVHGLFVMAVADGQRILSSHRFLFRRFAQPEVRSPLIYLGPRRAVWTARTKSRGSGGTQDFIDLGKLLSQLEPLCLQLLLPRPGAATPPG